MEFIDMIRNPSDQDNDELCGALKIRLGEFTEEILRSILSAQQLGDRKPSQFRRHLLELTKPHITDNDSPLVRQIFLQAMPDKSLPFLQFLPPETLLDTLAGTADRVVSSLHQASAAVDAVSSTECHSNQDCPLARANSASGSPVFCRPRRLDSTRLKIVKDEFQYMLDQGIIRPRTQKALRRFLGSINFYHNFIPHLAEIRAPVHSLLEKKRKGIKDIVKWTPSAEEAFNLAKTALATATSLHHPDPTAQMSLFTDASSTSMGAVLQQWHNGMWEPLAFWSRKLKNAQINYNAFGRELLSAYSAIRHFRPFLEGKEFVLYIDHKPLVQAIKTSMISHAPREQRHLDFVLQFTTDVRHVSGHDNIVADALSRISTVSATPNIDFKEMALLQSTDPEFNQLAETSPRIVRQPVRDHDSLELICDDSTGTRSKVYRHVRSPVGRYPLATNRFDNIHLDIVGPLLPCKGFRYILTMVDRYTRWPEACPMTSIDAETVATSFISTWISRFGIPSTVVTDRGSQFTSSLWKLLTSLLGTTAMTTTADHPAANGLVERFHRQLKSVLKGNINWVDRLPLCLLGIRNCYKEDLQSLSADLVFGTTLNIPGDMVHLTNSHNWNHSTFFSSLHNHFNEIRPKQSRVPVTDVFIMPDLFTVSHVLLRHDGHRQGLQYTYDGPYKVLRRKDKTFNILRSGKREIVSID
ncbi:hypothetical protein Pmani_006621 [Petrolisthes manimaculis]|uniref:RNA-directed DNA polymerase n=1 Tax=Petrolisthes manimaculis TaxID=1843537 RepID=A0AAE1Q9A5_9EUCA|nr:hypothetical protein Pmani_006621 [Petrolisthes manimaculis]